MKLVPIAKGVNGLFIQNNRFSTTHISVNLYLPLKRETVAVNALLPFVLSSCSAEYPDFSALNLRLNELYGADVGGIADKIGDTQVLRFFSYFIDDEYIPNGDKVADEAVELLISMLFKPSVKNGSFLKADVEREKRLTLEKIAGIVNDKRSYAISRIIAEMYKDEPFGELKTGSAKDVAAITGESLFNAFERVLSSAEVRIQVIGKKLPDRLFDRIAEGLKGYERITPAIAPSVPKKPAAEVNRILEEMDVSQGKLVMGFCTDCVGSERETAFLTVFADLFGGGPYSKLFANVREKLSLCYYCAARPNRNKGYILVDCGVESENAEKAENEILNQLNELKKGNFTDEELNFAISSIKDSLACLNDSEASLDGWYAMRPFGEPISPEEFISLIEKVTKEDIIKAAGLYRLDTVYKIMPQGKKGE
ncbi:MAG: insulinase family protein [Clostridia bacterium]|nr:insulinase family protein [Clostridia bacterium]